MDRSARRSPALVLLVLLTVATALPAAPNPAAAQETEAARTRHRYASTSFDTTFVDGTLPFRRRDDIDYWAQPPEDLQGRSVHVFVGSHWNPGAPGRTVRGRRGTYDVEVTCRGFNSGIFQQNVIHQGQATYDRYGNVAVHQVVDINVPCQDLFVNADIGGNMRVIGPGNVIDFFGFDTLGSGACVPDSRTLCVQDGRFQVQVDWREGPRSGTATPVPNGDTSGMFWFFNPSNTEAVAKVLNDCPDNDRFAVFFAGLTNVPYDLSVTDTESGEVRKYPGRQPFQPIQDTNAFATCP